MQSGCRQTLCLKSPDDSTLQPELRIAVLRAVSLETGMPGEMHIVAGGGVRGVRAGGGGGVGVDFNAAG